MKKLMYILFLSCLSGFSNQEVIEVVGVNVKFEVQKCALGVEDRAICDNEDVTSDNIFIPLGSCDTLDGIEECYGAWQGVRTRDAYEFYAIIIVNKKTENQKSTYTWNVSVGPVLDSIDSSTAVTLFPREGNTLSDAFHLDGALFWDSEDTNYFVSSLHLGPIALK